MTSKRAAWLTDVHLNFLGTQQVDAFLQTVLAHDPDVVLISGDIGEAHSVGDYLLRIESDLQKPVYFVLGNHDFYFGSFSHVRSGVTRLTHESRWLSWLNEAGVVELAPDIGLVGHDSWADGRCGDYINSPVMLNDYVVIAEFAGLDKEARWRKMNALGDAAADYFRRILPSALERYQHIFVLTHVPPFKESCWHNGAISDDNFLPHFTCKAVGDALLEMMREHPDHQMTVLCGHTHGSGQAQILPNLRVLTGGAEYGAPTVQQIFEV